MNILKQVSVTSYRDGAVSSYSVANGPGVDLGSAQGSLSNYRLKPPAGGRSVAKACARSPAAA